MRKFLKGAIKILARIYVVWLIIRNHFNDWFPIMILRMRWAILKANILYNSTGYRQYFVLKYHHKFIVRNKQQIDMMKRKGLLSKDFNWLAMQKTIVFKTPSGKPKTK